MKSLVLCLCGHPMDWHDHRGCMGERVTPCGCRRNQEMVLEAAIDAVRSDPDRWQAHFESARGQEKR